MRIGDRLILAKSNATEFFATVARDMRLIAPRSHFGGDVMFEEIESPREIAWDYGHDIYPPGKRYILPHYEDMFRYKCGAKVEIEDKSEAPRQAIVGIRSCDVKSVRFQERFYNYPIVDTIFKARADNTVLFSLVCNEPPNRECFCICCDSGPYLDSGYDVQLTDLGDRFLYEIGSEKGLRATEPAGHMLDDSTPNDIAARRRIELHSDSLFDTVSYVAKAINFISYDEVSDAIWERLGATCMRCGACTNLCPICTCYTVDDRPEEDGGFTRYRWWDSCQFSGFTREASGHNPRPTFGTRVQRRFYHKMSYQYIMRDGTHGCAGCGRCILTCCTKLGVPDVVRRIRRGVHAERESEKA